MLIVSPSIFEPSGTTSTDKSDACKGRIASNETNAIGHAKQKRMTKT